MAQVNVLLVVDVEGALSSGDLQSNIYLVDSNKYVGSGGEGSSELTTKLYNTDTIVWSVAPVQPGAPVEIAGFSGAAISDHVISPTQATDADGNGYWQSRIGLVTGTYQYTATLQFETRQLTFDPFLNIVQK